MLRQLRHQLYKTICLLPTQAGNNTKAVEAIQSKKADEKPVHEQAEFMSNKYAVDVKDDAISVRNRAEGIINDIMPKL